MTGRWPDTEDDDRRALNDLDQVYGDAYDLAVTRSRWMAYGLSTGRWLVASCAAELRRLIAADFQQIRQHGWDHLATHNARPD